MNKPNEYYINISIYEDRDSWVTNRASKIVKTRKEHLCFACQRVIQKGMEMLLETGIDPDKGRVSSYTCGPCVDKE